MVTADRIIKLSLSTCLFFFDYSANRLRRILGRPEKGYTVVLYFHSIRQNERALFARKMDDLIKRTRAVPAGALMNSQNGPRQVAVTFDDGFANAMQNALPELEKRNIPAIIFVPTGLLGGKAIWIRGIQDRDFNEDLVSADHLQELANSSLVTLGSHCITHPNLLFLPTEQAQVEISQSKRYLEDALGRGVDFLSFPHGSFNREHIELAKKAGYKRVFSIMPDFRHDSTSYVIGRVKADPSDWSIEFRLKLLGAYRWLGFASDLKSKLKALRADCFGN